MTESMQERLDRARAHLEQTQKAVADAKAHLSTASATVRSRDRSVEVTVNAQGHLGEVKFLDGKYRNMGATQLAASVLEASREAHAQMARTVMDAFRPFSDTPRDLLPRSEGVDTDWEGIFGPLMDTVRRGAAARGGASDHLRDEITEDPERKG
ncbi:YbaB/EbfC family nucleoid-associated protein [Streptomyces sp. NPDC046862]|uniref:YbaB/EbfC family nucleoid-associated protein n=1 Tax=Streptomyces sp. NPDC046862 TaxID=3154603 RepID=UPI003453E196